jgi:receptor protein-tyrosine kinase
MSRNFELMQQFGEHSEAASTPKPSVILSKAPEEVCTNGAHFGLAQIAHEETLRLVQRIFLQQKEKPPHAVLFAGIDHGNGCSQICLSVAETLASTVKGSVCLVEANFRSPSLPALLGTTNHYGLVDALMKEGPIRSFAKPVQADNVWLLSCGSLTADSPNLLNSDHIRARFEELRKEFDYVLVDAPPLNRYADATALGRLTDGLVLIVEAHSTRKEATLMVMESLRAAQIPVLGAVLNKRTFPIPESLYHRL